MSGVWPQYDPMAKKIYVNLQDKNIFAVIDPSTDEVVGRYPVGTMPGKSWDDAGCGPSSRVPFVRRERSDDRVQPGDESTDRVFANG
jgi:hypothetical protein